MFNPFLDGIQIKFQKDVLEEHFNIIVLGPPSKLNKLELTIKYKYGAEDAFKNNNPASCCFKLSAEKSKKIAELKININN